LTGPRFEIDAADPNDVIRVLKEIGFERFIVLEDFHYLSEDTQKEVAIDLKAFHEKSDLCFIVVGVWLESNRLVLYNGDLAGRLVPVDADQWSVEELSEVVRKGEALLNVAFPGDVRYKLLEACQGNIGLLQEALYRLCESEGVHATSLETRAVGTLDAVDRIVRELAQEQAGRYQNFLTQFVQGFQKTELEMYKWIAHTVVTADAADLKRGLKASTVHRMIEALHPDRERLLFNNTLQALKNVRTLQHRNLVQPVILEFDTNENLLQGVDSGFILFIQATPKGQLLDLVTGAGSA